MLRRFRTLFWWAADRLHLRHRESIRRRPEFSAAARLSNQPTADSMAAAISISPRVAARSSSATLTAAPAAAEPSYSVSRWERQVLEPVSWSLTASLRTLLSTRPEHGRVGTLRALL